MAQTNAQRQAAYRTRHLSGDNATSERLSLLIDVHTKRSLERLAAYHGITQRAMLQTLLASAEKALVKKLPSAEQAGYYAGISSAAIHSRR